MDDLENKNVSGGNREDFEKNDLPEIPVEDTEITGSDTDDGIFSAKEPDDKEIIESQLNDLVSQLKAKNEEKILKDDVQDWDGLIDDSKQDAEDFVLNESTDISAEKIESIEVMEIDEDDERLCSICHRRLKLEKDGVTYEYCKRCRNELLDTKYNWKSVLTFIVACAIFVCAVALSAVAIINAVGVKKAAAFSDKLKLVSASNAYGALVEASSANKSEYAPMSFEDIFGINAGDNTIREYIDLLFKTGDFSTLKSTVESLFTDADLEKPQNADIKEMKDKIDSLYNVGNAASSIIGSLQSPIDKQTADKAIADIEKLKEKEELDDTFLTYYQYYVCSMLPDSYEMQLEYLEKLKEDAPDLKIFYLSGFANTYLYMEDYDKCLEICDEALKDNVEDFSSWRLKVRALTRQKKYDEALELCDEALKIAKNIYTPSSDDSASPDVTYGYSVYIEQAIVYAIKDDMKKAQDAIDKAYQGQLTLDTVYLYAMINGKNGNDEAYDEVMSMLSQYSMSLPAACEEYINGTKTLEEIIVDGKVAWYE